MKISNKGHYALRLLVEMAMRPNDKFVSLSDLADSQGLPKKYLEQIAIILKEHGLLMSIRGPQGGYRLAKSPAEYSFGEVLRLTRPQ